MAPEAAPAAESWFEKNIKILHRERGEVLPFRANRIQEQFRQAINRHRKENNGMIRINVLKARRGGISTYVQMVLFRHVLSIPNFHSAVVSHSDVSASEIFKMFQLFRDECPIKHAERRNNIKAIEYEAPHRSSVRMLTVGSDDILRGAGLRGLHLSETAFWPEAYARGALTAVTNTVVDAPGTMVFNESTACGQSGAYYDQWQASRTPLPGQIAANGWENCFFPWLLDDAYTLNVPLDSPRWANIPREWFEDEPRLRSLGATDGQLAWRRMTIGGTKCGGDPQVYSQEYPATPDEAFISTGRPFFNPSVTTAGLKAAQESERTKPSRRYTITETGEFVADPRGPFRVWEEPMSARSYFMPCDLAKGEDVEGAGRRSDYSTFSVFDAEYRREIAVFHGRMPPDVVAEKMYWVGKRYGWAEACPEANNAYGYICLKRLLHLKYPNLTRRQIHDKATLNVIFPASQQFTELGFFTTSKTRDLMLTDLEAMTRRRELTIMEPEAWQEMNTFQYDKRGKPQARRGSYDDRVMRLAIAAAHFVDDAWSAKIRAKQAAPEPYTFEWFKQIRDRFAANQNAPTGITL